MSHVHFPDRHKYALIVTGNPGFAPSRKGGIELPPNYVVSNHPPFDIPKSWIDTLGEIQLERIRSSRLFIAAVQPSEHPHVLDDESEILRAAAHRLYFSALILVGAVQHAPGFCCTGGVQNGRVEIRQSSTYPMVHRTLGAPHGLLTVGLAKRAARMSAVIARIGRDEFSRTWRVTHALYQGLRENQLGERLHQFVRCVEGFIKPKQGQTRQQFKQRTRLFLGPGQGELAGILFDIRSAVEHLHGPLGAVPFKREAEKHEYLARYTWVAELTARHCLIRLLETPDLMAHFQTDEALDRFWTELTDTDRRALWGDPIDLKAASAAWRKDEFDKAWAGRESS